MSIEVQKVVPQNSSKGRLLRFLFNPPPLGSLPQVGRAVPCAPPSVGRASPRADWLPHCGFAGRLAKHPPDLVTHLGMVRSNAYYAAGCPLELCDHAAARDLWAVIHRDVIAGDGKEGVS